MHMSDTQIDPVLVAFGLATGGPLAAKRQRLRRYIRTTTVVLKVGGDGAENLLLEWVPPFHW
jgi:hypothetical protein